MKNRDEQSRLTERLNALIASKSVICFFESNADKEHPKIKYDFFGDPKTNELYVRVRAGRLAYVAIDESPLLYPFMADRIFGPDVADYAVAEQLSEVLWDAFSEVLLREISEVF